jgi:hypothetical protein
LFSPEPKEVIPLDSSFISLTSPVGAVYLNWAEDMMLQDGSLIMGGRVNARTGHHTTSWDVSFIDAML